MQVGITGGIGSGKSMVCRIFHLLGVPVYDADSRAKSLMTTDGILISAVKKEFGVLSYNQDGTLNRNYLALEVFSDKDRLTKLNNLVHPRVGVDYERWLKQQTGSRYIIKEAALIFETGTYRVLDKVIVVHAPEQLRIKRVLQRDTQRSEQQIREIIRNQLPEEEKILRADYVIDNDENRLVIPQVIDLDNSLSRMAEGHSIEH
jgi:dephospho-CoA kinase